MKSPQKKTKKKASNRLTSVPTHSRGRAPGVMWMHAVQRVCAVRVAAPITVEQARALAR